MQEKISMPSSGGGLVRYFEGTESKIKFKPGHLVLFILLVIIIEFFLHSRFGWFLTMFPGINPSQMKQAMKKLGIKQEQLDANEVIIKCSGKDLIIKDPNVVKVNMAGQETLQITGDIQEVSSGVSEDDIKTVVDQAKCSEDDAKKELEKTNGDIAEAILNLKKE